MIAHRTSEVDWLVRPIAQRSGQHVVNRGHGKLPSVALGWAHDFYVLNPRREQNRRIQSATQDSAGVNSLDFHPGVSELFESAEALDKLIESANSGSSLHQIAASFKDSVIPGMLKVREIVDWLESVTDDEAWPLPKYREMLFQY